MIIGILCVWELVGDKFVDFGMMLHEYSEKELEEKIRKKQEKWCG